MPSYAFLVYKKLPCPHCGKPLKCGYEPEPCYITFSWGYCAGRTPVGDYEVGDTIKWRPCRDGRVRGWTSFGGAFGFYDGCNFGSPEIKDLIVTDVGTDVAHFPEHCQIGRAHV